MLAANKASSEGSVNYLILRSGATKPMTSLSFENAQQSIQQTHQYSSLE